MGLPSVQPMPTPQSPFVFIHIEKTGGTTLREFISEAADRHGLQYVIPCHGGLHCVTLSLRDEFGPSAESESSSAAAAAKATHTLSTTNKTLITIPPWISRNLSNVSVVAGHFFWDVWDDLPTARTERVQDNDYDNGNGNSTMNDKKINFSEGKGNVMKKRVPPCFIMGRHPVERAISYYYQRCFESTACVGYRRRINELSVGMMHRTTNISLSLNLIHDY